MIEIIPIKKINAEVSVPGSKYVANRAILLASLADGESVLYNLPENNDIKFAIDAFRSLGINIKKEDGATLVSGGIKKLRPANIDVGESGTLLRFIIGLSALINGETTITGTSRIKERPIKELLYALRQLGIDAESLNNDFPPARIRGGILKGGKISINSDVSSQFISSLLMIAPYALKDIEITTNGDIPSMEYIDMTISLMQEFGVQTERVGYDRFKVKSGQKYSPRKYTVPTDFSSASYFMALAAIVPGAVKLKNIDFSTKQGEARFSDLLVEMGCITRTNSHSIQVIGGPYLNGIDVDMSTMPDVVQTLCAVAPFATGITRITNIANLKHKESDRIVDTAKELANIGINVRTTKDSIEITGGKIIPGTIDPHNDHRMAMSLALIGARIPGIRIKNHECVNKSFPNFWDKLKEIGVGVKHV